MTKQVTVDDLPDPANIQYVGSSSAVSTATSRPSPSRPRASVGDKVVLAVSINDNTRTFGDPTGVTGLGEARYERRQDDVDHRMDQDGGGR